jgi:hypothetical protein
VRLQKRYAERRPGASYGLPAGLVVLSESAELAQKVRANAHAAGLSGGTLITYLFQIISKELAASIDHYSQFIDFIHVSDQYYPAASPDEQCVRLSRPNSSIPFPCSSVFDTLSQAIF